MVFVKCLSYGWQIMIKVLIVDDEYIMRQGLKYMIDWEQEGFEIVGEATNGAEALQCIESLAPQIIICDIVMPQLDGVDFSEAVHRMYPRIQTIILSGYDKNYTPEDLRQKYYPVLDYDSLSKELSNTFNIKNTDFYYDSVHLSKEKLQEHLKTNRPILICVWNQPHNNRWTTASHYMVLLASDDNDMVYISNPNGGENDSKSSGWYKFKEVTPYIAKALYIESY